ncbi:MAG: hypothetical protein ABI548_17040 [Polyangiaceae bacterium]
MKYLLKTLSVSAALLVGALTSSAARAADPTTGDCLAASEASLKLGNKHALRAERSQLLVCSSSNCPADIRRECTRRVDEVNGAIPTIIFEAKDADGQDLSAVKVTMDGEVLAERLEGSALSIDPGEHTFTFETPGQPVVEKKFVIREAQKERREQIAFGTPKAASPASAAASVPAAQVMTPGEPQPSPLASDAGHGLGTQKTVAIVAGGVGVVGVVVGAIFGLQSKSKHDKAASLQCSGATCPDASGVTASSDARSAGNISTVAFVVGAVGLAGGAALWFTAKPAESSGTQVGLGLGTIQVRGAW